VDGRRRVPYTPQDLAKVWDQKPIWGYLYTVVERDGTLEGVDPKPYEEFKRVSKKPLLASGGVASLEDLKKLYGLVKEWWLERQSTRVR
jgi:phosphoribosylformimino-5-aminoimidazole carboxamide ribotide isomerase